MEFKQANTLWLRVVLKYFIVFLKPMYTTNKLLVRRYFTGNLVPSKCNIVSGLEFCRCYVIRSYLSSYYFHTVKIQLAIQCTIDTMQARSQGGFGRFGRTALTKKGPLSCNERSTF